MEEKKHNPEQTPANAQEKSQKPGKPQKSKGDIPCWVTDRGISEIKFANEFLKTHEIRTVGSTFFTVDGRISDEDALRKEIFDRIQPYLENGLSKKVNAILDCIRIQSYTPDLPLRRDRIHVANGTFFLHGAFLRPEKEFCRNRLPVAYNPEAPDPVTWIRFLEELLEPQDILTLQEFMGYCLLPTTKAQKMLLIVGKGGEGKSRIGVVLRALFGCNMITSSIAKVENNRFARADLEHALVMLDDDMQMEALTQTNYIKSIVTAELPMDLEKKGKQSYQGKLYVRFIGLGNGALHALYDRSEGFFRRQILLTTKDKAPERRDDPFLGEKLCREMEGIFLWCLGGLYRLLENDYRFTISSQAEENLSNAVSEGNNLVDFMNSEGYFRFRADSEISSKEFYEIYKIWCEDNILTPVAARTFSQYLKSHENRYRLESTNNVLLKNGKRVRGFRGIEKLLPRSPWENAE